MKNPRVFKTIDGCEAAACVAYRLNVASRFSNGKFKRSRWVPSNLAMPGAKAKKRIYRTSVGIAPLNTSKG